MGKDEGRPPLIGAINVIRFAAVFHFVLWSFFTPESEGSYMARHFKWLFSWGASQVGFLVVISGFTLGYNYVNAENFDKTEFYVKRASRFPLFLAALVLPAYATPMISFGTREDLHRFVTTLVGIHPWIPDVAYRPNPALWATGIFIFLHLLFPYLLPSARNLLEAHIKVKIGVLVGMWVLSYLLIVMMWAVDDKNVIWSIASPFLHLPTFFMGVLTGSFLANRQEMKEEDHPAEKFLSRAGGLLGLSILFLWYFFVPTYQFFSSRESWQTWFFFWNHIGTLAGVQCFFLYWVGTTTDIFGMVLNFRATLILASLSPSLYLFGYPVDQFSTHFNAVPALVFWVSLSVICIITVLLLEIPFYDWALETYRKNRAEKLAL